MTIGNGRDLNQSNPVPNDQVAEEGDMEFQRRFVCIGRRLSLQEQGSSLTEKVIAYSQPNASTGWQYTYNWLLKFCIPRRALFFTKCNGVAVKRYGRSMVRKNATACATLDTCVAVTSQLAASID